MTQEHAYPQRVRDNILPLSEADKLVRALAEWRFSGSVKDHGAAEEVCQLCDQESLRYHFEITNDLTGHSLEVGSQCILRFEVPVYENGERLTGDDPRKHLNALTQKMRLEACIKALEVLSLVEDNRILKGALEYYKKHKKLTPKYAFVVFWKLQDHQIDHQPSFFSISLKKHKFVEDLREMETDRVHRFWRALTPSQRQKAVDLGHPEPKT